MADFNNLSNDNKNKSFTIRDAFEFILYNWYWFLLSIVVFTLLGAAYALSKPNVYRSSAMVLVDSKFSRTSSNDMSGLTPTRMLYSPSGSTEDEIIIMGSRTIMNRVVDELEANVSYSMKGRFRETYLYAPNSPVAIETDTIRYPFTLKLLDWNNEHHFNAELEYRLPNHHKNSVVTISGTYGQTITDTVGVFRLRRQNLYNNLLQQENSNSTLKIAVRNTKTSTERYMRALSIAPAKKYSNVINISITNNVPQSAADIVNKLIEAYNEDAVQSKRETARATINFIDERLASVEVELGDVDSEIERLKSENSTVDLLNETRLAVQTSKEYEKALLETHIQLEMVNAIKSILESAEANVLPVNIGIEDHSITTSIKQYNDLVLARINLGTDSSDENPIIRELNQQIASLKSSLGLSVSNYISSLTIRIASLQRELNNISKQVGNIPTLEKEAVSIMRNQKIKDALYTFLLNKREEAALQLVATNNVAQVIDPAVANNIPVAPHKSTILLIFFIIGLLLPALVIYLIDQLRIRIASVSEIEKNIQVPVIGAIPSKTHGMRNDKIVSPNSRDAITEAFRMVRTNLDFTLPEDGKVIMVTSSMPGEGKSFVSINLSLTLGITGKRVLLVDLDLRKASLSEKISGKRQTRGLVNYLVRKDESIDKLIAHDAMHNVDVLYVGIIPPNPAEILAGNRIYEVFEELKSMYDYIVVDTPPVGLVTDTMLINRVADITIFSVRVGRSLKRYLSGINTLNQRKALHNLNVIITDIGAGKTYTKDTSTYGYGYGYGYGYDVDKKISLKTRFKLFRKRLKRKK